MFRNKEHNDDYELNLIVAEVLGTQPPVRPEPQPTEEEEPVKEFPVKPVSEPAVQHSPQPTEPEAEPEEDVLIYLPKASVGGAPAGAVRIEEDEEDEAVRVVDDRTRAMPPEVAETLPPVPLAPIRPVEDNQLRFEGYDEEPVPPPTEEETEAMEANLREERERKASAFRIKLAGGEEEDNEPDEEPEQYETEYIEDFASYDDADAVRSELDFRLGKSRITLIASLILEAALVIVSILGQFGLLGSDMVFWVVTLLLFVGLLAVCGRTLRAGFADLRDGYPSSDTAAAVGGLLSLLQTVATVAHPDAAAENALAVLGGLGLVIASLARERQLRQLTQNFRFVGHTGTKTVCSCIEDEKVAMEIGHMAVASGVPQVAYYRPANFLTHFLARSYERADDRRQSRIFIPVMAGVSLVTAVVFGLMKSDWMAAFRLFVLLFMLGQPLALGAASFASLTRVSAGVLRKGGLLINRQDAASVAHTHALAVDAIELFPGECVVLGGIKTFSGTRIDDAIIDAASVSIAAGGPLSEVFRRIIENKLDLLHEVETLTYEQEMGLSGWVNGRRVLVGNRRLLENHGVDVPSRDYEMRYSKGDRQLVYLSTAGELSAMFVVSYIRSEEIAKAVHRLGRSHITLLVRTCDPNITSELICRTLGADDYYVEVLGSTARRRFEQLVGEEPTDQPAGIASNGRIEGQAAALVGSRRLHTALRTLQIAAMLLSVVLLAFVAVVSFTQPETFKVMTALLYMLLSALLSLVLPLLLGA